MQQNSTRRQDDHSENSGVIPLPSTGSAISASPIPKLPPELLAEIFLLSISGTYLRADAIRLAISSVRALWRQIVLDLAALWTTLIWVYFVKWTSTDDGTSTRNSTVSAMRISTSPTASVNFSPVLEPPSLSFHFDCEAYRQRQLAISNRSIGSIVAPSQLPHALQKLAIADVLIDASELANALEALPNLRDFEFRESPTSISTSFHPCFFQTCKHFTE